MHHVCTCHRFTETCLKMRLITLSLAQNTWKSCFWEIIFLTRMQHFTFTSSVCRIVKGKKITTLPEIDSNFVIAIKCVCLSFYLHSIPSIYLIIAKMRKKNPFRTMLSTKQTYFRGRYKLPHYIHKLIFFFQYISQHFNCVCSSTAPSEICLTCWQQLNSRGMLQFICAHFYNSMFRLFCVYGCMLIFFFR